MEPKAWILSSTTYGTVDYVLHSTADCSRPVYYVSVHRKDVPIYVRTYSQCSQIHESRRMIVVQDSSALPGGQSVRTVYSHVNKYR
jgi:hypothetical protein